MQKKLLFPLLVFIFVFSLSPVLAQDSSPSATDQHITDNLKKRIQESLQTAKQNLITSPKPIAYIGQIEDVIQHVIKIKTPQNETKTVSISDQDTTIIRTPSNKQIKLNDVQLNDKIIAMGYLKQEEGSDIQILSAKRVIVSQTLSFDLPKITGYAKIKTKTASKLTLIKPDQSEITLSLSSTTVVKNQTEVLSLKDLAKDQTVIFTAKTTSKTPLATIIMIVK